MTKEELLKKLKEAEEIIKLGVKVIRTQNANIMSDYGEKAGKYLNIDPYKLDLGF